MSDPSFLCHVSSLLNRYQRFAVFTRVIPHPGASRPWCAAHYVILLGRQNLAPFGIAVGDCIGLIRHCRFPLAALRSTGYVAPYQRRYLGLEQSGAGCTTQTSAWLDENCGANRWTTRKMSPISISRADARRIWLHAQRLDEREPFGAVQGAVQTAIEHLGYVQIDTIN